jgi:hypothetical protein
MRRLGYLVAVALLAAVAIAGRGKRTTTERRQTNSSYKYAVEWYNQTLDHFTFTTDDKFRQKYLVNDTWWNKEKVRK